MKKYSAYILSALSVVGVAAASLVGCSSSIEAPEGTNADDLRIKPTGTETWSSLTVQLPNGSCQPGGSCSRPLGATANITVDGASVALGAKTRLKPGDHTLAVNNVATVLTMTSGQTRTLTLPVAHRKCEAAALPTIAQTQFGKSVSLSNASCPATTTLSTSGSTVTRPTVQLHWYNWDCPAGNISGTLTPATKATDCAALGTNQIYSISINGVCTNLTATSGIAPQTACTRYLASDYAWTTANTATNIAQLSDVDLAFVPGSYAVNVANGGSGTTQSFTLNEGAASEVAVSLPVIGAVPATFSTSITFADTRELPDAAVASITSSCSGDRSYSVPASATTKLQLKAFQATGCVYTLNAGGRTVTLDQGQANDITLNRLDIDNVTITREDSSTYVVTGTYELYFGGNRVVGPLSTNSGVDILPGTYELVTKFTTADGLQTQRQTIQL